MQQQSSCRFSSLLRRPHSVFFNYVSSAASGGCVANPPNVRRNQGLCVLVWNERMDAIPKLCTSSSRPERGLFLILFLS